jgi:hypothetical protein
MGAGAADPAADRAHAPWQLLGSDEDQGRKGDDNQFRRVDAEHAAAQISAESCRTAAGGATDRRRADWADTSIGRSTEPRRRCSSALRRCLLLVVGHAGLEALQPLGDVAIIAEEAIAAEQEQDHDPEMSQ